jgi:hypothetical protein
MTFIQASIDGPVPVAPEKRFHTLDDERNRSMRCNTGGVGWMASMLVMAGMVTSALAKVKSAIADTNAAEMPQREDREIE